MNSAFPNSSYTTDMLISKKYADATYSTISSSGVPYTG